MSQLPGEDLVRQGLLDLGEGRQTVLSFLVAIARPRLVGLGVHVPPVPWTEASELLLYRLLRRERPQDAYSHYNALVRTLISYEQALESRAHRPSR